MNKTNFNQGFTFIELLIVLVIVSAGTMAAIALLSNSFSRTMSLSPRLTASYIAQEGVEVVRRIRDEGWLEGRRWDGVGEEEGIAESMAGTGRVDYLSEEVEHGEGEDFFRLYKRENENGGYLFLHDSDGEETIFERRVDIERNEDHLSVRVIVTWEEKGETRERTVHNRLYNWYE